MLACLACAGLVCLGVGARCMCLLVLFVLCLLCMLACLAWGFVASVQEIHIMQYCELAMACMAWCVHAYAHNCMLSTATAAFLLM